MDMGPACLLRSPLVFQVGAEPHFPCLERVPTVRCHEHRKAHPAPSTNPAFDSIRSFQARLLQALVLSQTQDLTLGTPLAAQSVPLPQEVVTTKAARALILTVLESLISSGLPASSAAFDSTPRSSSSLWLSKSYPLPTEPKEVRTSEVPLCVFCHC